MIISHSHRFIFIHIPKCGGTAVSKALMPYLGKDDVILGFDKANILSMMKVLPQYVRNIFWGSSDPVLGLRTYARRMINMREKDGLKITKHAQANDVREYVGKKIWSSYYKFSFVRNPWDRVVSLYFWYKQTKWRDFEGFADKVRELPDFESFIRSEYLRYAPYSMYLYDTEEPIVDFIGKQETLEKDFQYICRKIGLPEIELTRENVSNRKRNYIEYYNEETKQIIYERFQEDIKKHNYYFARDG
jgi:hypothetical protein